MVLAGSPGRLIALIVQPECREVHPMRHSLCKFKRKMGYYTPFSVVPVLSIATSFSPVQPQGCVGIFLQLRQLIMPVVSLFSPREAGSSGDVSCSRGCCVAPHASYKLPLRLITAHGDKGTGVRPT